MNRPTTINGRAEAFFQATIETFKIMIKMDVSRGEIVLRSDNNLANDVSGMIGLTGDAEGSVTLGLPRPLALAITRTFLGEDEVSDGMMADTVGELVNIITGFAKKDMPDQEVKISLPTVILGNQHIISDRRDDFRIVTRFNTPIGSFQLSVYLENLPEILGASKTGKGSHANPDC